MTTKIFGLYGVWVGRNFVRRRSFESRSEKLESSRDALAAMKQRFSANGAVIAKGGRFRADVFILISYFHLYFLQIHWKINLPVYI
jgi:hypothetical protein